MMRAQDRWCRLNMAYMASDACLHGAAAALRGRVGEGVLGGAVQDWLAWGLGRSFLGRHPI